MTEDEMNAEIADRGGTFEVRGIEVRPYEHAIPCQFPKKRFILNPVSIRQWSEDGTKITLMLDSHNFLFVKPDEMVEVVLYDSYPSHDLKSKFKAQDIDRMNKSHPRRRR